MYSGAEIETVPNFPNGLKPDRLFTIQGELMRVIDLISTGSLNGHDVVTLIDDLQNLGNLGTMATMSIITVITAMSATATAIMTVIAAIATVATIVDIITITVLNVR